MYQTIGLLLLIIAVSAAFYIIDNPGGILNFGFSIPGLLETPSIYLPDISRDKLDLENRRVDSTTLSPFKSMRISSIKRGGSYIEVRLSSSLSRDQRLNITGWTIKSNNGEFQIPKAQNIYSFERVQEDIIFNSGDYINLYSGRAEKGNFRLNKCMGYIEDSSPFIPSISKRCPRISNSEIAGFSGKCQDYLLSLRACENYTTNPPISIDDFACHKFASKLNYVGCVSDHQTEPNFLMNEWRAWLDDEMDIFDQSHDRVRLIDRDGNVIDEYTY